MAEVLQLAQLVQHHGVADMDVGRGRIQAQLDAQRHAGGFAARQLLHPFGFDQQFVAATLGDLQGVHHRRRQGVFGRGARGNFSHDVSL
ncbi:hypothetical protein D9M71_731150 [compost metagenome]